MWVVIFTLSSACQGERILPRWKRWPRALESRCKLVGLLIFIATLLTMLGVRLTVLC